MKNFANRILELIMLVFLCGCATPNYSNLPRFGSLYSKHVTLAYAGEPKPLSEVGVISHDAIVYLVSVNGEKTMAFRNFQSTVSTALGPINCMCNRVYIAWSFASNKAIPIFSALANQQRLKPYASMPVICASSRFDTKKNNDGAWKTAI